jgi:general secretion pathway protein A
MYERFFGFRERPFDLTPNPRFLVLTESHREVLSNLEYAISSRKGMTLVIGEAGSGKTTLIRAVLQRQPERVHSVHLNNPTLSRDEFVETLAEKFDLSMSARRSKAALLVELEALLCDRQARGEGSVLIVDEAQSVPLAILEEIRLLANIEADEQKLLSVILAGQPELADRLEESSLRQLKQRVALRCELRPLAPRETAAYLAGRISAAGGVGAQVFTREAVTLIHEASGGLPRTVSVLADNALLGGFAAGQRPVSSQTVREICRDFRLAVSETPVIADRAEPAQPARPRAEATGSSLFVVQAPRQSGTAAEADGTDETQDQASPERPTGWWSSLSQRRRRLFS